MKKFLISAGLVLLALLSLLTNGLLFEKYRQEKSLRTALQNQVSSFQVGKQDTVWLPGDTIRIPGKSLRPVTHAFPGPPASILPDTITCKGMEYTDSLIKKNLALWYTIKIENGCVAWVAFDYQVKDQVITQDKIIYQPQLLPASPTWHASVMATGWSDQSMTFGAGFTLPDRWGFHLQVDPFRKPSSDPVRTRWGAGITYNLR